MTHYRNVPKFTPRQDNIVIENKAIVNVENPNTTAIPFNKSKNIKGNKNLLYLTHRRFQPLLSIILIWLIIPVLRTQKNKTIKKFSSNFREKFNAPENIINMLSDVSPYLGLQEQDNIQTLIGIFEAINILNSVRTGTYQSPRILKNIKSSISPQDKKIGIIKALKPYLPSNNHETIDKVLHTFNAVSKVSQNLVHYKSETAENAQKQSNIDKINKILETITPIIPYKQKHILNQIRKMIKMYTAMEATQLWEKWTQQNTKQTNVQEDTSINNVTNNDNTKKTPTNSKKNVEDTLKSVLNPEQSQAMEVMMKMAQLLSQTTDNNEENYNKND